MGCATTLTLHSTSLSGILLSVKNNNTVQPEYEIKYKHVIDVQGVVLSTSHGTTTAVVRYK